MIRIFSFVGLSLILASAMISALPANHTAAIMDGLPGSPNFGYGARLDPFGDRVKEAIQTAGQFDLDWIVIELDWDHLQPKSNRPPDWARLDHAISLAQKNNLAAMLSISNPPDWVITSHGPDSFLTASLIQKLAQRYPNLQALELFPGANTVGGWGTTPNPKTYTALLKSIYKTLENQNTGIILVTGGLLPISEEDSTGNIPDSSFLEGLYASGAMPFMAVVGIQLPAIRVNPTTPPDQYAGVTLRHYEVIRAIMLENNHQNGLIWVTGFSWDNQITVSPEEQSIWLKQAYLMMRRQLYIGSAFFQNLNPSSNHPQIDSLIKSNNGLHPGFAAIGQIIAQENSSQTVTFEWTIVESDGTQPTHNR